MGFKSFFFFVIYIISLLVFLLFPSEMVLARQVLQVPTTKEQLHNFQESKTEAPGSPSVRGPHGLAPPAT
ncbi:hypothetical protein MANES_17G093800v8 [Manihot esculenta]|uniref:Uncharacterized protein n=1 Tax=Manihot esculenta TaxID=3983 RepID=A0A2C9U6C3_MANES|nr:hypothetical protein MANES_17G093800v8 [Manihot esculenta]